MSVGNKIGNRVRIIEHMIKKKKNKLRSNIIGYVIGAIIAFALFASGCGITKITTEEIEEVTAPVVESIDDSGNVVTVASQKDYLEAYDEKGRKELARQALEQAGEDTAIAENKIMTFGVNFDVPEGFMRYEGREDFYTTKRYPIDASNIQYMALDVDYTLQMMDESEFEAIMEEVFQKAYDEYIDIEVLEYKEITIDGIPGFRIMASYSLEGEEFTQLMYVINGSKTYLIIYTQTQDYDRMEVFEESATTIQVRK